MAMYVEKQRAIKSDGNVQKGVPFPINPLIASGALVMSLVGHIKVVDPPEFISPGV